MRGQVTQYKDFTKQLQKIIKGHKGKAVYTKYSLVYQEFSQNCEVKSVKTTNHGETRLKDCTKYDLGEGYRLVTVSLTRNHLLVLYVGSHDEAESWLNRHKNYQFTRNEKGNNIEFIPCAIELKERSPLTPSEEIVPDLLFTPIFKNVSCEEFKTLGINNNEIVKQLKECSYLEIDNLITNLIGKLEDSIILKLHNFTAAINNGECPDFKSFIKNENKKKIINNTGTAKILQKETMSENFFTFSDLNDIEHISKIIEKSSISEWMLYLHADQAQFVCKKFNGPARLSGVSGSGKTSIAVHRARFLAKKYRKQIWIVTLNKSLKNLFSKLLDDLCGIERMHLTLFTTQELSRLILSNTPSGYHTYSQAHDNRSRSTIEEIHEILLQSVRNDNLLSSILRKHGYKFFREEFKYIRERFHYNEYNKYLNLNRYGRVVPLVKSQRMKVLELLNKLEKFMTEKKVLDYEGMVIGAIENLHLHKDDLKSNLESASLTLPQCIVIDEVQDLSSNELFLVHNLVKSNVTDNLFLTGDTTQKIYNKISSFKEVGIDIRNRSYFLKKNYRNTHEIVNSAYKLVENFTFENLDTFGTNSVLIPDLPSRRGEKPKVICFDDNIEELKWISKHIKYYISEKEEEPSNFLLLSGSSRSRNSIFDYLKAEGIPAIDLKREKTSFENKVKISTIESAKGHEFKNVIIFDLVEDVFPPRISENDEKEKRLHASRLYVAMTRATTSLIMSYSNVRKKITSEKNNPQHKRNNPSLYLEIIQDTIDEFKFTRGKLTPRN